MNFKIILLGLFVGYISYYLYTNYIVNSAEKFNPLVGASTSTNNKTSYKLQVLDDNQYNDISLYNDRHVRFNNNIDVIEYESGLRYSMKDDDVIEDTELNNIVDNLLNKPVVEQPLNNDCYKSINKVDKNKMFDEIENEINDKYNKYSNSEYFDDVDRSAISTNILNSNDIKMSNINQVINPNCYTEMLENADENTTIWEQFDKMTTNNYKQFDKLDDLVPNNLAQNNWTIGSNQEYGSRFDNYAANQ